MEIVNYRLSPKANPTQHLLVIVLGAILYWMVPLKGVRRRITRMIPWLKALAEADFVGNISGGDSFSDLYELERVVLIGLTCWTVALLGKDLVQLPQTYGPYNSRIARTIARLVLRHSSKILARDFRSLEIVRTLFPGDVEGKEKVFCPDVAFVLDPLKPDETRITPPLVAGKDHAMIGLNVSGLLYMGGYTRDNMFGLKSDYRGFIAALIERVMTRTDAHLLVVPHVFGDDLESDETACREVWETFSQEYGDRLHLVNGEYSSSGIKAVIGQCDFFIGSRMHSCIAALSQGIPTVGVAYSDKFRGVFDSVGMGDMVLDARDLETQTLVERCLKMFEDKAMKTEVLAERIREAKQTVCGFFEELVPGEVTERNTARRIEE